MLKKFWNDDCGAIVSTEIVLVITILGIGMIVGLTTLRDQVVQELADVSAAVGNIDQSYSYSSVSGHTSATSGSVNVDVADFCDDGNNANAGSSCVNVNDSADANGADTAK
jgi:Flp pilus assembly pilin Flp